MNPNEFYTPPNLEIPSNVGSSINSADSLNLAPSSNNQPSGFEKQNNWARSVQRSKIFKQGASVVINTRLQLVNYLKQSNLDLLTSSIEFEETGDFILSSYVMYKDHNNFKESLTIFIDRYPALKPAVEVIRERLRPIQNQLKIKP